MKHSENCRQASEFRHQLEASERKWEQEREDRIATIRRLEGTIRQLKDELKGQTDQYTATHKSQTDETTQLSRAVHELRHAQSTMSRELAARDATTAALKSENEALQTNKVAVQQELQATRGALTESRQRCQGFERELAERRADSLRQQSQVHELEEEVRQANISQADVKALREEIFQHRLREKEATLTAEQERALRAKVAEDCTSLVRENTQLGVQVTELQRLLETGRSARNRKLLEVPLISNSRPSRAEHSSQIEHELACLRDSEKQAQGENARLLAEVKSQAAKVHELTDETALLRGQLQSATDSYAQLESAYRVLSEDCQRLEDETVSMQREKALFEQHMGSTQQGHEALQHEVEQLRATNGDLSHRLAWLVGKVQAAKQAEVVQTAFQAALANMKELADMVTKSNTEAANVISKRVTEGLDEIKAAVVKVAKK